MLNRLFILNQAASGDPTWNSRIGNSYSNYSDGPASIAADSTGNLYICAGCRVSASNNRDTVVIKLNTNGVVLWKTMLTTSNDNDTPVAAVPDASGNLYLTCFAYVGSTGYPAIIKLNASTGAILWQKYISNASNLRPVDLTVDSSGNPHLLVQATNSYYAFQTIKLTTTGAITWQRKYYGSPSFDPYAIAVDSSGNVFCAGRQYFSGISGATAGLLIKYNSSGIIQWQKALAISSTAGVETFNSVACDASGNVYVAGFTLFAGRYKELVAKYDTNGTLQWQNSIGSNTADYFSVSKSIAVSSDNSIYIVLSNNVSGYGRTNIVKMNSSGSLIWSGQLYSSYGYYAGTITSYGTNIYVSSQLATDAFGTDYISTFSLPADGSKRDSVLNGINYDSTGLAVSDAGLTEYTRSYTDVAGSYTIADGSFSFTTPSFTTETVTAV